MYLNPEDVDIIEPPTIVSNIKNKETSKSNEYVEMPEVETDEQIEECVRAGAETNYHHVGTCKMGNDEMAVVDDKLRVRGVENLRVVDASIMPTLIGGNTNAPTVMIADKISDHILGNDFLPPISIPSSNINSTT